MWVDIDMTFDAFLAHVGPTVTRHPLPLAFGTFVLPETSLLTLIWSQALSFRASLWTVFDVVTLGEAEMAEVSGGWTFAWLWYGQTQVTELVS